MVLLEYSSDTELNMCTNITGYTEYNTLINTINFTIIIVASKMIGKDILDTVNIDPFFNYNYYYHLPVSRTFQILSTFS